MIRFACAQCAATLSEPDHAAGRKARCPRCGAQTEVPEAAAADGRMNWPAVSSDGRSEEVAVSVRAPVAETRADVQPPPIDYPGIVRRVLRPYARTERISFPDGVPGAPGIENPRACPRRPEEPAVALFDCRRRETSRTCILFTPTGLRVYRCTETAAPAADFVPYCEFPAKRIAYGKRISEIVIGKEHAIDAWGSAVIAPSILGVLQEISAEVRGEQRARGEFVVPEWLREDQCQEDVCPQCGSDNTIVEGRRQEAPVTILTAILLSSIPLTGTGVFRTWGEPYHRCFDCGFVWGVGKP